MKTILYVCGGGEGEEAGRRHKGGGMRDEGSCDDSKNTNVLKYLFILQPFCLYASSSSLVN